MALARLLHKIVVCWGDFLLLFAKLLELISRIFSSTIIIRKFLCVKSLNQWHGMVWKRLPWFDLVSIKGVNSKNMFFPNLHVFRINFISKKNPYFLPTPPSVKLICLQLLYLSGMKTHFDQSIFPTHSENWDFSHQMFFLINEIRLLGDHPLATGGTGAWNTPFTVVYAVLSTQMNFQSFQANLLLSWQRPHTVRNGNFL